MGPVPNTRDDEDSMKTLLGGKTRASVVAALCSRRLSRPQTLPQGLFPWPSFPAGLAAAPLLCERSPQTFERQKHNGDYRGAQDTDLTGRQAQLDSGARTAHAPSSCSPNRGKTAVGILCIPAGGRRVWLSTAPSQHSGSWPHHHLNTAWQNE